MEKLQKALNKARQERGKTASGKNRAGPVPRAEVAEADPGLPLPEIWNRLPLFDPDPATLLSNRVITLNAQSEANPFDVLRTKIFLLMQQNGWSRMAITSPDKACGKSTTACNLAFGFSRQREVKSILLDLDLRRPGIANILGHKPQHDIKDLLLGEVSAQEQMVRLRSNVAISMAERPVSDPIQVLMSQQTATTIDTLQKDFEPDVMMFDLPPMLVTDDARAMLSHVDCALIVARAEQTKISQLDICEREVAEQTNVLGVVLNNCRLLNPADADAGYY
ncbi:tyrosine-protein kinase family protein [Roseobacter weihaiensis]|uniref:tyrosine-protein kinase family protein n=1 Tax=Roseobacter weihaiensis TaxID=2763262 RepID=UPI001D0B1206|nr:CpsD/CapB family tyrosine-protein kinase [Roseobacter sp. H9]